MATTDELLNILMKDYKKPEDLIGENGLLKQKAKADLKRKKRRFLRYQTGKNGVKREF